MAPTDAVHLMLITYASQIAITVLKRDVKLDYLFTYLTPRLSQSLLCKPLVAITAVISIKNHLFVHFHYFSIFDTGYLFVHVQHVSIFDTGYLFAHVHHFSIFDTGYLFVHLHYFSIFDTGYLFVHLHYFSIFNTG